MNAKINEALEKMKYRRFWHRDHDHGCDVVCVNFRQEPERKDDWDRVLQEERRQTEAFINFLNSNGINAYEHFGPTGVRFAAIDTADKDKLEALS
jgi:hypothetical protein